LIKSLSHKPPHDEDGGELDEGEVVLRLLLPADEQFPVAVEPRMRALDDPAPRPRPTPTGARLFAAPSNVRLEPPLPYRALHDDVVVALVETEVLLRAGRGPDDAGVEQLPDARYGAAAGG